MINANILRHAHVGGKQGGKKFWMQVVEGLFKSKGQEGASEAGKRRGGLVALAPPGYFTGKIIQSEKTQGFAADPVYGRAKCLPVLGEIKT